MAFCLIAFAVNASPVRVNSTDELIYRLRQAVQSQYEVAPQNVLVLWNDDSLEDKLARVGKNLSVELTERDLQNLIGKTILTLKVMDGNRYRATIPVKLKVDGWTEVYISKKPLRRGEMLSEQSIQFSKKKLSELPVNYLRVLENPGDYRVNRDIPAGMVLNRLALEQQPLVLKGAQVKVVVVNENLRLMAQGEVLENGLRNQMVSVRVLSFGSNKLVQARVTGQGEVTLEIK